MQIQKAIQSLPSEQRRAVMQWLTTQGPFLDNSPPIAEDYLLEACGVLVNGTAIGEAAECKMNGLVRELVSFTPSDWQISPINVICTQDNRPKQEVPVINHWELSTVQASLAANPKRLDSWLDIETHAGQTFTRIAVSKDAFAPLQGHPFVRSAADRILVLLHTLDELKSCFDENGQRTADGHRLYNDHFTGDNGWFSDSSASEKNDFRKQLTFPHPDQPGQNLFCTWHGKIRTPPYRIHFSWPIRSESPLYVVYIGPKLTKR